MDLNNKRILVVGLGKSGVASALFLKRQGARVTVSDTKSPDQLRDEIPQLLDQGIAVETTPPALQHVRVWCFEARGQTEREVSGTRQRLLYR